MALASRMGNRRRARAPLLFEAFSVGRRVEGSSSVYEGVGTDNKSLEGRGRLRVGSHIAIDFVGEAG